MVQRCFVGCLLLAAIVVTNVAAQQALISSSEYVSCVQTAASPSCDTTDNVTVMEITLPFALPRDTRLLSPGGPMQFDLDLTAPLQGGNASSAILSFEISSLKWIYQLRLINFAPWIYATTSAMVRIFGGATQCNGVLTNCTAPSSDITLDAGGGNVTSDFFLTGETLATANKTNRHFPYCAQTTESRMKFIQAQVAKLGNRPSWAPDDLIAPVKYAGWIYNLLCSGTCLSYVIPPLPVRNVASGDFPPDSDYENMATETGEHFKKFKIKNVRIEEIVWVSPVYAVYTLNPDGGQQPKMFYNISAKLYYGTNTSTFETIVVTSGGGAVPDVIQAKTSNDLILLSLLDVLAPDINMRQEILDGLILIPMDYVFQADLFNPYAGVSQRNYEQPEWVYIPPQLMYQVGSMCGQNGFRQDWQAQPQFGKYLDILNGYTSPPQPDGLDGGGDHGFMMPLAPVTRPIGPSGYLGPWNSMACSETHTFGYCAAGTATSMWNSFATHNMLMLNNDAKSSGKHVIPFMPPSWNPDAPNYWVFTQGKNIGNETAPNPVLIFEPRDTNGIRASITVLFAGSLSRVITTVVGARIDSVECSAIRGFVGGEYKVTVCNTSPLAPGAYLGRLRCQGALTVATSQDVFFALSPLACAPVIFLLSTGLATLNSTENSCVVEIYTQAPPPIGYTLATTSSPTQCVITSFEEFPTASPPSGVSFLTAAPSQLACPAFDISCSYELPDWANLLLILGIILLLLIVGGLVMCCCGVCGIFGTCMAVVFSTIQAKASTSQKRKDKYRERADQNKKEMKDKLERRKERLASEKADRVERKKTKAARKADKLTSLGAYQRVPRVVSMDSGG